MNFKKGFFSHSLNTKENVEYESPTSPDLKYFEIDEMNEQDRVCCLSWYQEEKSRLELNAEPYVLRKEMIKYC